MLPFFKTVNKVKWFITFVDSRAKVSLLMETPEAVAMTDRIVTIPGIDEIHIGLNCFAMAQLKSFASNSNIPASLTDLAESVQSVRGYW
jgi:2-keto-3-deoxy-L-rhamnonate aldolase RhmA